MYGTITEANTYFADKVKHEIWDEASDSDKTRGLKTATIHIDRLNFLGDKTEEDQENEFPRNVTDDLTPDQIKYACYEIAYSLLEGKDPELELETLSLESASLSPAKVVFNRDAVPEHLANFIVSALAWSYLKPYLRMSERLQLHRI